MLYDLIIYILLNKYIYLKFCQIFDKSKTNFIQKMFK